MSTPADTLAASLAQALAPRGDRGSSALVAGSTRATRRALLDAAATHLEALASATPPLVVRLGPRAPGARFADELGAAVETALQRLRAPGGLYDDRADEATRSLGPWLFRARAVGRVGIVLVVEELDGWLDARGARRSHGDPGRDLAALLDETARRSLSVLAGARAGEASGAPSLPGPLARRFGVVHVLGGASAVTRDPGTLVAALAGRTFSLSSLGSALEGWLDLPAAPPGQETDDTLIVFSSPLAPPVLESSEVEWTRGAQDPRVSEAPAAVSVPPRDIVADAKRWPGALRAAVAVREAVRRARDLRGVTGVPGAERLFRDAVAHLPLSLEALAEGEAAVGAAPTGLARAAAGALARYHQAFGEAYRAAGHRWAAGGARPTMLCDLPPRLAALAGRVGARGTAFVVLTGLRWDLWGRFRERVLGSLGGLTLVEEGTHWAAPPGSVTAQRTLVARGPGALSEVLAGDGDGAWEVPGTLAEALRPRREHFGSTEALRLDAYAAALALPGNSLGAAAEAVEEALPAVLRALCGGFAGRTAVLLAADVGASGPEDTGGAGGGGRTIGGDSAFAVVVPYALLTWG